MDPAQIPPGIASRFVTVLGQPMHYLAVGAGPPVVFLHGNPTSSYLWRHVLPHAAPHGRCLAPDLIGMGRSGKPAIAYRLHDHIAYVDGFIDALGLTDIAFVLHDWGVTIGLHYLARFPERVRGVAFMEGRLRPVARWADLAPGERTMFERLRAHGIGRHLMLDENLFIEQVLPSGVLRSLTAAEMDAYRAPFRRPADREPIWRWVQEIPIAGEPADVRDLVEVATTALVASSVPKLLVHANPGAVLGPTDIAWCERTLPRLTRVDVGAGIHFLPEDQPHTIGTALARWLVG